MSMTDQEVARELRNTYEQARYMLQYLRGMTSTIDAILQTLLSSDLATDLRAKLAQSVASAQEDPQFRPKYLSNTQELFRGLDVQIRTIDLKIQQLKEA